MAIGFKNEVVLIVNSLANAVVLEIFSAAEKVSLNSQNPEVEEKLGAVVDSLCLEAVNKILRIIEPTPVKQDGAVGEAPPTPEETCEGLRTAQTDEEAGVRTSPTEDTYFLVDGSSAVDPNCLLVSLPGDANDDVDAEGGRKCSSSEVLKDLPFPAPPHSDDHKYARSSSAPAAAASVEEGGIRGTRRSQRREKTVSWRADKLLQCSRCNKLFPNAERLTDHQRKSHPLCSVCGVVLSGILKLREHKIKEHGLLPYSCDFCPKRFNHKAHRDLHVKTHHTGEKNCHCDVCGKGYSCVSMLKSHRLTHFDKTFICDVCGKAFYHACHLTRHKLVHQEVRPYTCSTCGRGFSQAANLRSHQVTHNGERQLCSICGKSFRCLKNHIISKHAHELAPSDAVISCDVCGKKFPNQSQHRAHRRSHTGEKPFHCDVCGKSYRLKELLRDHRYTHTGDKPYRCSLCARSFNLASSFLRHRSIHSGETPFSCSDCGKHFRLLTFLKAHLQTKAHLKLVQQRRIRVSSDL
ncbi:oocyte zinc finger protein XlCOF6 [Nothobranchius furzeri]|uniref:Oocyte zinc finger protein XlCOF6-like n=1 Tax=Nothobranchius furzeri TaxID=105023 RepID=A0A1A8U4G5_NOTFU|nr:oocyte zinc finger protein XlCOF6-like [Nothobranchius furzeri]